jgi:putative flippase GtrA
MSKTQLPQLDRIDAVAGDGELREVPALTTIAALPLAPQWLLQLIKYGGVACVALATDVTVLTVSVDFYGLPVLLAAALGFCCGLTVNYLLCIQWVFDERVMSSRRIEFAVFGLVGVLGLAFTEFILLIGAEVLAYDYRLVKLFAVAVVFCWNFTARKALLFTKRK